MSGFSLQPEWTVPPHGGIRTCSQVLAFRACSQVLAFRACSQVLLVQAVVVWVLPVA